MSRLVAAVMLATLAALIGEVALGTTPVWVAISSLVLIAVATGLAAGRTVRSAVRLGSQIDGPEEQSTLARTIYRDHVFCFLAVGATVILQIAA
jgi:hypothetical protein